MPPLPSPPSPRIGLRARALLLAAALLFSYAYFYQGTGWNQNSHFDLARVLLEEHTVSIDHYQSGTGDKAFYQGHYYSDKAPGLSLLGLPAVAAGTRLARVLHLPFKEIANLQLYLATLFTDSLGMALAGAVLFLMLLNWNISPGAAGIAVVVMGLGTPMWDYATQFWGHALAAACLVFGFAAADRLPHTAAGGGRVLLAALAGLAAGWAVVSEYPAAIPAVMIGAMALIYAWRASQSRRDFFYAAGALCLSAGLCLATILIYQKAAFGSPFRLGYEYVVNYRDTLQHGELGLTYPHWHALLALLAGKRCGLLLFAPILLVAPVGFWLQWRAGRRRLSLGVSAGIALYYLLFNASYLYWEAGSSFGPRYLSPGLPFACIFVAPVWERARPALKALLAALVAFGVLVALAGVTSYPVISEAIRFPLKVALPALARGEAYRQGDAVNLGELAGLHGLMTVAPLVAMWGVAALIWWRLGAAPVRASVEAQTVPAGRME